MNATTETTDHTQKPIHSVNATLAEIGKTGTTPGPYVITVYNERGRMFYCRESDTSYTLVTMARDATVFEEFDEAERVRLTLKETIDGGETNVTAVDPETMTVE